MNKLLGHLISRGRLREETGAVAIIVALFLVALLVLVALVVDLGGLYVHDRDLQSAADAAALAGAQQIVLNSGGLATPQDPAQVGRDYVKKNTAGSSDSSVVWDNLAQLDVKSDNATFVAVNLREDHVPFWFARVIGNSEGWRDARARAEVKYLTGLNQVFPVALLMMNPNHFNFTIKSPNGSTVTSFDLRDNLLGQTGDQGIYDSGSGGFTPTVAGNYSVTMQTHDASHTVGLELPDIGIWRSADTSDPKETIYKVGMTQAVGSSTVAVRIQTAASVTDATLSANLGHSFTLTQQSPGVYAGTVTAPSSGNAKDRYATFDLTVSKLSKNPLARYIAFNPDVPVEYLMMVPGEYDGYSGLMNKSASVSAVVKVRIYTFGDTYTMKLGNQQGSGMYSGNWRAADIYQSVNAHDEVATIDPPSSWQLVYPLRIGGPLRSQPGAAVGQWIQGLSDRLSDTRYPEDVRRTVFIPIVDYDTAIHGSDDFRIQAFAAFYITDFSDKGSNKGDCVGTFIRWAQPGEWSDTPPGPLYVETVVLTE